VNPDLHLDGRGQAHGVSSLSIAHDHVRRVVESCFPTLIEESEICLSVLATLLLQDLLNPVAVNFEAPPSTAKTTLLDFFRSAGDKVYRSDKFTPKAFVSHSAAASRERLEEIDLLPRIRHKLFIVPELAPLFGLRADDLLETISILTRVLDGQGLTTDSGVHGRRGHTGDYHFAWIGCTTPIPYRVWKLMTTLGSRFLFFEMPTREPTARQLVHSATAPVSYKQRVELCAEAYAAFLEQLWEETGGVRAVTWRRDADPQAVMLRIADYAKLLAKLRGTISVWREGAGDDQTYNFSTPIIEGPQRAMSQLYALARGGALIHGHRQLTEGDLWIVRRAALESTPNDRRAVMRILLANDGVATTKNLQDMLRCSAPTGRAILETLEKLGIGTLDNPGPPVPATLTLDDSLRWLLEPGERQRELETIEKDLTPCTRQPDRDERDDLDPVSRTSRPPAGELAILEEVAQHIREGILVEPDGRP
jgi:hypothetical protein